MRNDRYTIEMADKLIAKMRERPEMVFNALGQLEELGRQQAESYRATGEHERAMAYSDAARAINVVREWCPSW